MFLRNSAFRNDAAVNVSLYFQWLYFIENNFVSSYSELKYRRKKCGSNEEAKCAGVDQPCEPVSRIYDSVYYPEAKCFCKEGYLRFSDGQCRPPGECMLRG